MKRKLFLAVCMILLLISCESFEKKDTKENDGEKIWKILEESVTVPWTKQMLEKVLGKPSQIFDEQKEKGRITWIYDHKAKGWQQWAFSINSQDQVFFASYHPAADKFQEFSMDFIMAKWTNYNCKNVDREVRVGYFFRWERFYECHGNRRFDYNKYNEVNSISIGSF